MPPQPLSFAEYLGRRWNPQILGINQSAQTVPRKEYARLLARIIGLEQEHLVEEIIRDLVNDVISLDHPLTSQVENLLELERQLRYKAPELFEGAAARKSSYIACRLVISIHRGRRHDLGKSLRHGKKVDKTVTPPGQGSVDLDLTATDSGPDDGADPVEEEAPDGQEAAPNGISSPLATVETFLKSCKPPMDRFLPAFAQSGCTNEEYLRSIASATKEEREDILKRILNFGAQEDNSATPAASNVDVWMLDLHLTKYIFGA